MTAIAANAGKAAASKGVGYLFESLKGPLWKNRGGLEKAAIAVGGADIGVSVGRGVLGGAKSAGREFWPAFAEKDFQEKLQQGRAASAVMRARQRREMEMARLVDMNTRMLAEQAPQVFNQVMAGRRLPKGAVVFGGTPRVDLLQEVAMSMSRGQYGTGQSGMGM